MRKGNLGHLLLLQALLTRCLPWRPLVEPDSQRSVDAPEATTRCLTLREAETLLQARLPLQRLPSIACSAAFLRILGIILEQLPNDPNGYGMLLCLLPKLILCIPQDLTNSRQRERDGSQLTPGWTTKLDQAV